MVDRRTFIRTAAAASVAPLLTGCSQEPERPWGPEAYVKPARSRVAVLTAGSYDGDLVDVVRKGLSLFELSLQGKRVVLKPNLVEFDPDGVINTNPVLIAATMEAFRSLGAADVVVAEGPGHRRDNEHLLTASGLHDILRDAHGRYIDLNVDAVARAALRSHYTPLDGLYLPRTVLGADLLVSMPKMKTHHWAGVTLSLKNMFGIMPGAIYGWPKNVLHYAGIAESILDINAALQMPRFNIVDGIVGMEGDGPILGDARRSGVLVMGADPVAVDATAARLMTIDPWHVGYLREADSFLGNVAEEHIEQLAEDVERHRQDYVVLPAFGFMKPASVVTGG
ncbi:MAG: DUF362 domain-containing protein [Gemmatimonadetes bacterium]|nr:DUF362 domain-containing protein [Gemmatimonadota bacterium]